MVCSDADYRMIKNDRFELMAILRTLFREKEHLQLSSGQGIGFEVVRLETGRIFLQALQETVSLPGQLDLIAEGSEAKIIFTIHPETSPDMAADGLITGTIPDNFDYYQRRVNLRVPLPLWKHFTLTLPASGLIVPQPFFIYDFSAGGVGVYIPKILPETVTVGAVFKKARLSLGEYGDFNTSIEIIAINPLEEELAGHPGYQQRMSVRFTHLSLINQRNLQKIAYAFEVNFKRKR